MARKQEGMKPRTKRLITALLFVALVCVGLAFHTGVGTPSMLGVGSVAALCPLGGVEAAIASRSVVPAGVIGLAIAVALVLLFGRAFCAWGCPMGLLRRLFGLKSPAEKRAERAARAAGKPVDVGERAADAAGVQDNAAEAVDVSAVETDDPVKTGALAKLTRDSDAPDPGRGGAGDSRMWVLGGALLSTAAFGFPVFCLVCPVGLTFATVICLWRALQFGEATLSLVVFPAILIVEVVVLRRWCHSLCPLGALMSLIARVNKTFRATLNTSACLQERGARCGRCADACPEGIDLHDGAPSTPRHECIKCGECRFACPVQAISFPALPKKGEYTPARAGAAQANESKGEAHE